MISLAIFSNPETRTPRFQWRDGRKQTKHRILEVRSAPATHVEVVGRSEFDRLGSAGCPVWGSVYELASHWHSADLSDLVPYWRDDFDWPRVDSELNSLRSSLLISTSSVSPRAAPLVSRPSPHRDRLRRHSGRWPRPHRWVGQMRVWQSRYSSERSDGRTRIRQRHSRSSVDGGVGE
jgi:hypothetical protein